MGGWWDDLPVGRIAMEVGALEGRIAVTLSTEEFPYGSGIFVLVTPHTPSFCVLSSCLKCHLDDKSYVPYSLHSVQFTFCTESNYV